MTKFVVYLTFIPWLLYFSSVCKNAIKDLKRVKVNKEWIRKNIFKIFHFENIILFGIFIYFSANYKHANQIWLVDILLFSAINLYLFFNRYYDKNRNDSKIGTGDVSTILIILLLISIPLIYYVSTHNYVNTYYILFAYSFFNYLIVFIAKSINDLIMKIIRKRNSED